MKWRRQRRLRRRADLKFEMANFKGEGIATERCRTPIRFAQGKEVRGATCKPYAARRCAILFVAKCNHWIHAHGTARGDVACRDTNDKNQGNYSVECPRVRAGDAPNLA